MVRKLVPLLLAGGLLQVSVSLAGAQQMCSASTAPTVRNPGYPGSMPYSNVTNRVTSNCTGPSVDANVQPDPFYGAAFIPAHQPDPSTGADPAAQVAQYFGYGPGFYGPSVGGAYGGYGYPGWPGFPPSPYYGSGYGYATPFAAGPNGNCGPSGCGDLGAAPFTATPYGYVPSSPNNPAAWSNGAVYGGYGYGGYGYAPNGYGGYPYWWGR